MTGHGEAAWMDEGEQFTESDDTFGQTSISAYKLGTLIKISDELLNDIRTTMEDSYIGKYPNTYDNKCLLIAAINNYFQILVDDNIIASGIVEIDLNANSKYLAGEGKDISSMSEDDIKTADTGSYVYLKATVQMLDAIEDIVIPITM